MSKPLTRLSPLFILLALMVIATGSRAQDGEPQAGSEHLFYLPTVYNSIPPVWIGPDGGTVMDLAVDPNSPNTAYAATWGGGLFKTVNGGANWDAVNTGLGNLLISAVAVDPTNSSVLYAGTYKDRLYKSIDGGANWFSASQGLQEELVVYTIAIEPQDSDRIFIGTRGKSNNGGPPWNGVIYKSTNGGASWGEVLTDVGGKNAQDWAYQIAINPNSTNAIFAATHEHGPYRSTDSGDTWKAVSTGIDDLSGRTIVIDPTTSSPVTLYFGVWHNTGVYKSTNGGGAWVLKGDGLGDAKIYRVAIDPFNPNVLLAATFKKGIMKSTNAAGKWSDSGLQKFDIYAVGFNPFNSLEIYSGTMSNGLYKSVDHGSSWEQSQTGVRATSATAFLVSPVNAEDYFASQADGGVSRSIDGGATWSDLTGNLPERLIRSLAMPPDKANILYALTESAGLFRCDLSGSGCWVHVGTNLPGPTNLAPDYSPALPLEAGPGLEAMLPDAEPELLAPSRATGVDQLYAALLTMQFAPSNPQVAYLGTSGRGVYRSSDGGITWSSAGLASLSVGGLAVSPSDPNLIYAATSASGVVKFSMNGGVSWADSPIPSVQVNSLDFSAANTPVLFAATSNGVYRLTGSSWTQSGLPGSAINAIAAHPTRPKVIFAGTYDGAFLSTDGGQTWIAGPYDLDGLKVQAIGFDPSDPDHVYYATSSRGVLKASIP